MNNLNDTTVNLIREKLERLSGYNFRDYRLKTFKECIANRINELSIDDPFKYLDLLTSNPGEMKKLINAITVQHSEFFRDPLVYETISEIIIPDIIGKKKKTDAKEIRIWSAGCGYGEEAYSIAMLISENLKNKLSDWSVFIFGTDINEIALNEAVKGIYTLNSLYNTKMGFIEKYFLKEGTTFVINNEIKNIVTFSINDLTSEEKLAPAESVFGTFDMILCRNLIIYYSSVIKEKIITKIHKTLDTGSYLILGETESMGKAFNDKFIKLDHRMKIYIKK